MSIRNFIWVVFILLSLTAFVKESNKSELLKKISNLETNERLVFWAEFFVGTPYDPIPIGNYVQNKVIVDDSALDCMSHTFRSLELALAKTEVESLENATSIRFLTQGQRNGNKIISYDRRFKYGEDMALFGKFGVLSSHKIGKTKITKGSERYKEGIPFLPTNEALNNLQNFKTGDIIFFVKNPKFRKISEIVGHIGILKIEDKKLLLIHASGTKNKNNGKVKKVDFAKYLEEKQDYFEGILINRI